MANSKAKTDGYNKALEQASLVSLVLTSSSFKVRHDFHDQVEAAKKIIDQTMLGEPEYDSDSNLLIGTVRCRVWMTENSEMSAELPSDGGWESSIVAIEATYGVIFEVQGAHEQDALNAFFERMGKFSVWPYFRSHVAGVAGEACIDIPVLPVKKLYYSVKEAGRYVDPGEMNEPNEGADSE